MIDNINFMKHRIELCMPNDKIFYELLEYLNKELEDTLKYAWDADYVIRSIIAKVKDMKENQK